MNAQQLLEIAKADYDKETAHIWDKADLDAKFRKEIELIIGQAFRDGFVAGLKAFAQTVSVNK